MSRLLVSNNNANTQQIGEIVDNKPDGHVWGSREGLPNYIHVDVTDATRGQTTVFLDHWNIDYKIDVRASNPIRTRYLVEVSQASQSASGIGKDQLKLGMGPWVEREYNGSVLAFTPETFTCDVPQPHSEAQFRLDFADIWNAIFEVSRYRFSQADVDAAVANGGLISFTLADVTSRIIDKLDF